MAEPAFTIVGHERSVYYVIDTLGTVLFWGCALGTKQGARSMFSPLYKSACRVMPWVQCSSKSVVAWLL
jgi:hypothetical protein